MVGWMTPSIPALLKAQSRRPITPLSNVPELPDIRPEA
jgi:hypothetical protein